MQVPVSESSLTAVVLAVLTGVCAVAGWVIRNVSSRFSSHEARIAKLERDHINKDEFRDCVSEIYKKIDNGFMHLGDRLDKLYDMRPKPPEKVD